MGGASGLRGILPAAAARISKKEKQDGPGGRRIKYWPGKASFFGCTCQIWILDETDTCIVQSEMENGSIEPQAANVTKEDSLEVTATPSKGYEIASVAVNGSVLSEDSYKISETGVLTFTLSDITENQYVTVMQLLGYNR